MPSWSRRADRGSQDRAARLRGSRKVFPVSPYRAAVEFAFSLPTGRVHLCAIHPTKTEVNRYGKLSAIIRGKSSARQSPSTGINTLFRRSKRLIWMFDEFRLKYLTASSAISSWSRCARRMPSMTISYPSSSAAAAISPRLDLARSGIRSDYIQCLYHIVHFRHGFPAGYPRRLFHKEPAIPVHDVVRISAARVLLLRRHGTLSGQLLRLTLRTRAGRHESAFTATKSALLMYPRNVPATVPS